MKLKLCEEVNLELPTSNQSRSACAGIAAAVVRGVEFVHSHSAAAGGCVDELAFPDVHSDVGDTSTICAREEDHVTGPQIRF